MKPVLIIYCKDWCWSWNSNSFATWCQELTHWKRPDAGKDWMQEEKGMRKDKVVGWHHRLNGHELEQALGVGDEQGSLACCSPRGLKELDMTEWQNLTVVIANNFSSNTRDDSTQEHHQMVNNKIRLIIFFAAEYRDSLYSEQKQDLELTVAQIISSILQNSGSNWRK